MVGFLYRSLAFDRSRTALSVLAVAAAIVLVVVLEGFRVGLSQQARAYSEQLPVQLVVVQAGVENPLLGRSALPTEVAGQVKAVPGVREVHPLIGLPTIFTVADKKTPASVIGYHTVGGPQRLKAGRAIAAPGEVVMDYSLARKYGLAVGDRAEVFGKSFQIVGLSAGTSSMFGSYLFVGIEDAMAFVLAAGAPHQEADAAAPSFLLVQTEPGVPPFGVREAIERGVSAADVLTPSEMAANDAAIIGRLMGPVFGLLAGVANVVGLLVIGLTLYAAVFERIREYGVMKAVGARNTRLYWYVVGQALAFTAGGLVVGLLAGGGVATLLDWLMPQYLVVPWDGQVLLRTSVAAIVMGAFASLLPIRQVAGVDPAMVFRQ